MARIYKYLTIANDGSSGSWRVPLGVTEIIVACVGGGAGGGGGSSLHGGFGGVGGGGGGASKATISVTPGQTFYWAIGAGGTGGAPATYGNNGTPTYFSSSIMLVFGEVIANGGNGPTGGSTTGAVGDYKVAGGNGGTSAANPGDGGGGAASASALTGNLTYSAAGNNNSGSTGGAGLSWYDGTKGAGGSGGTGGAGGNASLYGGGGGGGYSATDSAGGNGAPGRIEISYDEPALLGDIFTSGTGSWVVPSGVTSVTAYTIGGGAGGATTSGMSSGGAGGGGGGASSKAILSVSPGDTLYYSVGSGGSANSNGGDSWVNNINADSSTLCRADGGYTGDNGFDGSNGGNGGSTSFGVGSVKTAGGAGSAASGTNGGSGGAAASIDIDGTTDYSGAGCDGGTSGADAPAGFPYGGGGGGGSLSRPTGGSGAGGCVILIYGAGSSDEDTDFDPPASNLTSSFCDWDSFTTGMGSSDTWTVPADVYSITVICIGGGAGGQGGATGGGGGEVSVTEITVSPGNVFYYQVGQGGAASTDGSVSWFNSSNAQSGALCLANGGDDDLGGTGGTGPDYNYRGRNGSSTLGGASGAANMTINSPTILGGEGGDAGHPDGYAPGGGGFAAGEGADGAIYIGYCAVDSSLTYTASGGLTLAGQAIASYVSNTCLTDNLISYWKLDETSGNAVDSHGSNTLTANGSPGTAGGKLSTCRTFNGSNQYFSIADNASLSTGDIDFTIACWVNFSSKSANQAIIGKYQFGLNGNDEYCISYNATADRFAFSVSHDGNTESYVRANSYGGVTLNNWIYIVAWHDSLNNTINIQVNNGTVDSVSHTTGVRDGTLAFRIGAFANGNSPFSGSIDEAAFWKRTLSADEREALYNPVANDLGDNLVSYWRLEEASGNAVDSYGSNTLTAVNAPGSASGKVGGARTFNGFTQIFSKADNASLSVGDIDFTFSAWVYIADKTGYRAIVSKDNGTNPGSRDYEYVLLYDQPQDKFGFAVSHDGTAGNIVAVYFSLSPTINTWYHVIAGHDSVNNQLWITVNNGTPATLSHTTGCYNGAATFVIGGRSDNAIYMNGRIDDVGFWKRKLSSGDISELNNSNNGLPYDQLFNIGSGLVYENFCGGDTESFIYTASGGLTLSGQSTTAMKLHVTGQGGLILGDQAIVDGTVNYITSGGLILGGESIIKGNIDYASVGGLILSGQSISKENNRYTASGGLALSGQSTAITKLHATGQGGLTLEGQSNSKIKFSFTMNGGFILSGQSSMYVTRHETASGGFILGGVSSQTVEHRTYTATGGIVLSGNVNITSAYLKFNTNAGFELGSTFLDDINLDFDFGINAKTNTGNARLLNKVARQKKDNYLSWGIINKGIIPAVTELTRKKIWSE